MDSRQFDAFTRALSLSGSRRRSLTTLVGSAFGLPWLGKLSVADDAAAKKNKKKKRKKNKKRKKVKGPCAPGKSKRNSCRKAGQCCTGVCRKKRCRCNVCASGCPFTSIQAAIDAASAGATISICAGTYLESLNIEKNVTLRGAGDGPDGTVLDGQEKSSAVVSVPALGHTPSGATVMLEGLRITGGNSGNSGGGGINNIGTLTLTGCTVTANESEGSGGGIANIWILTLVKSRVAGNNAEGGGGGIFNDGKLTLNASSVTDNRADAVGGGIFSDGILTVDDSSVTGNTATQGGGFYVSRDVAFTNSTVTGNEASGDGGGIWAAISTVTITNSSVMGNKSGNDGGGIYNNGTITLTDCKVTENTAVEGGGIFNIRYGDPPWNQHDRGQRPEQLRQ